MAISKKNKIETAKKNAEAKKAQKKQVRDSKTINPQPASKNMKGKKAPLSNKNTKKK